MGAWGLLPSDSLVDEPGTTVNISPVVWILLMWLPRNAWDWKIAQLIVEVSEITGVVE